MPSSHIWNLWNEIPNRQSQIPVSERRDDIALSDCSEGKKKRFTFKCVISMQGDFVQFVGRDVIALYDITEGQFLEQHV